MEIITVRGVHKTYPLGTTIVKALQGIDISFREGDFISIAGPSGSGKSTLLNLIGCMDVPSEGVVEIAGRDVAKLNDRSRTDLRHEVIGFVFQSFNLIPVLTVYENVEFPTLIRGNETGKQEHRDWILHLIEEVGLADRSHHKPSQLSGGQRQRVAVARALATKPRIVLADEPTANLDSATGEALINLMKRTNQAHETTFIFSTHDPEIVAIADHQIRLHDGRVAAEERSEVVS